MRPRFTSILFFAVAVLLVSGLAACGGDDGGVPADARVDAPRIDAAEADAAATDAPAIDAPSIDAANIDAPTDATPTSSEWIQIARAAADGTGLTLPIVGATVTYLKPAIGADLAGFTIQAQQSGPALMISVDPATLSPVPVVGDTVSFTITAMATVGGQRRATAVTGFTRTAQGASVGALSQNLSAASDLVTGIAGYDSEVVDISGTIATAFATGVGSGFEAAQITTAGMTTPAATFLLRVPTTVRDGNDMVMGCNFTLDNTPVGFFGANTQLAAFVAADFTLSNCPAPVVVSAAAASATSVQITFSRNILASSVLANGSQFTFDNGLTASAVSVSGRTVTVTTSAQSGATTYAVTVASTVTDLLGSALGTPNMMSFAGFVTPAVVRINELNLNIQTAVGANVCDMIELRVVSGGSMSGYFLRERDTGTLVTFTNFFVATNDIIVVHLNTANTMCNPAAATFETTAPNQQPMSAHSRNYDTAYDWYSTDTGLTSTDNVITLYNNLNVIMDAVFVDDDMAGSNVAAATETQAATVAAATQWQMVGGGIPVGGFVDDNFRLHAVLKADATGTTATGDTLQRIDNSDDNDKADWNASPAAAHSWGLRNAGQTAF